MTDHPAIAVIEAAGKVVMAHTGEPCLILAPVGGDDFQVGIAYGRSPGLEPPLAMSCIETALMYEKRIVEEMSCECESCANMLQVLTVCLNAMGHLKHGGKLHG